MKREMEKKKTFDPGKYGMVICPECYGRGFIKDDVGRHVCQKCGGFGSIKKEKNSEQNNKD